MKKKIRVGVISGGFSNEREISLLTGAQIVKAIPKDKYNPVLIEVPNDEGQAISELTKQINQKKIEVAFIVQPPIVPPVAIIALVVTEPVKVPVAPVISPLKFPSLASMFPLLSNLQPDAPA